TSHESISQALQTVTLLFQHLSITSDTTKTTAAQSATAEPATTDPGAINTPTIESLDGDNNLKSPCEDQQTLITTRCGTSPWEINFDQNRRQSPILRLPDEVLLQIMKNIVTAADMFMLRQVSFTFWRIAQGEDFRGLRCWEFGSAVSYKEQKIIALRAERAAFCDPCLQKRTSPTFRDDRDFFTTSEAVYCTYCEDHHRRIAFSAQQRHLPPSGRRCIGSYSSIRLCPHLVVPTHSISEKAVEMHANHDKRPSGFEKDFIGSCSRCNDLLLQDAVGYKYRWFSPPTLQLDKFVDENRAKFLYRNEWKLPFCKVPEGGSLTASFLLQKQEEFTNRYGD
ncbi:hypothetical protein LX32DRAFT_504692, partial [Colletotrichum zoysiae]